MLFILRSTVHALPTSLADGSTSMMAHDHEQKDTKPNPDTYSTAVNWDDVLFESVIDPFEQIAASERGNGQAAGRRSGFVEGRDIGRSKGWEIGLELGYIHGFASNLLVLHQPNAEQVNDESEMTGDRSNQRLDRCRTLSHELIELVNLFPNPDELLEAHTGIADDMISARNNGIDATFRDDMGPIDDKSVEKDTPHKDVITSLQRVRAKFKLLLVLLRTSTSFDLKRLLNNTEREDHDQTNEKKYTSSDDTTQSSILDKGSDW